MLKIENIKKVEGMKVFTKSTFHIIMNTANRTGFNQYGILMCSGEGQTYWIFLDRIPALHLGTNKFYEMTNAFTNEVVHIQKKHIQNPVDFATLISKFLDGVKIN